MKTTQQIRLKLDNVISELYWLNQVLKDESKMDEKLIMKSGFQHPDWTYGDYLTSLVRERLTLEWVLGIIV